MAALRTHSFPLQQEFQPQNSLNSQPDGNQALIQAAQTSADAGEQKSKGTKRKAPVDNQLYTCEVCHVKLNSASQAFQHFQGKTHIGKVRTLEQAAEVKNPPMMPKPLPQPRVVPHYQAAPPETSSINQHCSLCNKWFNSKTQADQHYSSKAHQTMLLGGISTGSIKPNTRKTEQSTGQMPGMVDAQDQATPTHEIKLGGNVRAQLFTCQPCNITLNSQTQMSQHISGLRHKIVVGKAKPPPPPNPDETDGWQGIRYKKLASTITKVGPYALPSAVGAAQPPGGTKMGQYYCQDCDVSMNSQKQMDQHLSSAKHKEGMKSKRKGKGRGNIGFRGTQAHIPGGPPRRPPLSSSFVKPKTTTTTTSAFVGPSTNQPQNPRPQSAPQTNRQPSFQRAATNVSFSQGSLHAPSQANTYAMDYGQSSYNAYSSPYHAQIY